MTVFDRRIPIHETDEGQPPIGAFLETLDTMLTQYNVAHSFAYAGDHEQQAVIEASGKSLCYWLYYDSEQNTEISLIIGLFMKVRLHKEDSKIAECVCKALTRDK